MKRLFGTGRREPLDTWSVISPDGLIKTKVFRKETHRDQYLNFTSNHPLEHKRGVVCTLLHRAEAIVSDPKDLEEEKSHIKHALCWNGYSGIIFPYIS